MSGRILDLVVIGGGINGAGIAADASARGLSVVLAEAEDLASATSSASSKLIHGGLRYLEHYEFRLVREALAEREVLLAKAPHIIRPLRFILPHVAGMRSELMMRAGLFLYDHLASRRTLGGSRAIDLKGDVAGAPLACELTRGFCYWDCWVDDARLVVLNAVAAREAGAEILTRTPVVALQAQDGFWRVRLSGGREVHARVVVNAAGPWVSNVADLVSPLRNVQPPGVRLVKGSHIVVPRIVGANDAYTFQNRDGRVVFALPFEDDFTLIGTTEAAQTGDPRGVTVTVGEERYLLDAANRFFRVPLARDDIRWSFAGVRPLDDDGTESASAVSRDYRLELDDSTSPPILHVIGGKITTYRKLAEAVLQRLESYFDTMRPGTTAATPLPGGDFGERAFDAWFDDFARANRGFDPAYLRRLARRYGTRASRIIKGATSERDFGETDSSELSVREIAYLKAEEWARAADDVLWRRTKAGLHLPPEERVRAGEASPGLPRQTLTQTCAYVAGGAEPGARRSPDAQDPRTASGSLVYKAAASASRTIQRIADVFRSDQCGCRRRQRLALVVLACRDNRNRQALVAAKAAAAGRRDFDVAARAGFDGADEFREIEQQRFGMLGSKHAGKRIPGIFPAFDIAGRKSGEPAAEAHRDEPFGCARGERNDLGGRL